MLFYEQFCINLLVNLLVYWYRYKGSIVIEDGGIQFRCNDRKNNSRWQFFVTCRDMVEAVVKTKC